MIVVPCPNCGPRNESDFRHVGVSQKRPDPNSASSTEWHNYLYLRDNPAGWVKETWYCRAGCRKYFSMERHTATNEFRDPPLPGNKKGGVA